MATPPYLCHCRVLQWIMKWIMQMSHNIFILTEVEVQAPVPGIYEYANKKKEKKTELAGMCYHLMKINCFFFYGNAPCFGSLANLWN